MESLRDEPGKLCIETQIMIIYQRYTQGGADRAQSAGIEFAETEFKNKENINFFLPVNFVKQRIQFQKFMTFVKGFKSTVYICYCLDNLNVATYQAPWQLQIIASIKILMLVNR